MAGWQPTKYPGVRYREHPTRRNGSVIKDRYYAIRYQLNGARKEEGLGWSTEGWTVEKAAEELAKLKNAARTGKGPRTLEESRKLQERNRREQEAREITFADYCERHYLPFARQAKPKSWHKEEGHLRLHLIPALGTTPLCDIQLHHWDEVVQGLAAKRLSQRTIEYVTGTLRRVLKHALRRKLVSVPPPSGKDIGATSPKDNRRQRVISAREKEAILEELELRDKHAWRMTRFAFLTGCRASEAFLLEWRNITSTHIIFERTKNSETRKIPLTGHLADLLAEIPRGNSTAPVFVKSDGKPYGEAPSAFATTVKALGLNEGRTPLDRITFHSIRHTVATELAKALDLRSLMDVMGWRVPAMALRYMHGNEDAARSALEMLGQPKGGGKVLSFRRPA